MMNPNGSEDESSMSDGKSNHIGDDLIDTDDDDDDHNAKVENILTIQALGIDLKRDDNQTSSAGLNENKMMHKFKLFDVKMHI